MWRLKCAYAAGCSHCAILPLNDVVSVLVYFVCGGVKLLCRWIKFCLSTTCPWESSDEVDLVNGNLSITISQLAVHSITLLPAWLPVIIY